jgi:hypothetical protein
MEGNAVQPNYTPKRRVRKKEGMYVSPSHQTILKKISEIAEHWPQKRK